MVTVSAIAQRVLDENNYTIGDITLTNLEYLIDNAIDHVNSEAGTSIADLAGSATAKTITGSEAEILMHACMQAICGYCQSGYFHTDVYLDTWDRLVKKFETAFHTSANVTRRRLLLGARDSVTGLYKKNYEESTIQTLIFDKGSVTSFQGVGTHARLDALGLALEELVEGDEIETLDHKYYEVKAVREVSVGNSFLRRECDLSKLPLHELSYSSSALASAEQDARQRTKVYWETYISPTNLQFKNFIVCYHNPDYPLEQVFRVKGVDIIFSVDQGTTESDYGIRYKEHVPTHVVTLDTELQWLGERELRTVVEEHPEGSLHSLNTVAKHDRQLGSTQLFDTEFMLNYTRTSESGIA